MTESGSVMSAPAGNVHVLHLKPFRRVGKQQIDLTGGIFKKAVKHRVATGNTKLLCIGINYFGSKNELRGCVYDAKRMKDFMLSQYGFPADPSNAVLMTDEPVNHGTDLYPSAQNMRNAIKNLVADAQPGDALFLHYSGHGGLRRDHDGNELTGFDETIYPADFEQSGPIVDDELFQILLRSLPAGVKFTAVFDSCHSGTVLDLRYLYDVSKSTLPVDTYTALPAAPPMTITSLFSCRTSIPLPTVLPDIAADVYMISGCRDDQLSTDACNGKSHLHYIEDDDRCRMFWRIECPFDKCTESKSKSELWAIIELSPTGNEEIKF